LSAPRLSQLIAKVTGNSNYRDKARWFQKVLRETRGLDVAADIIERVLGENSSTTRGALSSNNEIRSRCELRGFTERQIRDAGSDVLTQNRAGELR